MKYKIENGLIAVGPNGHPIIVKDDGTEIELRATELLESKIPALNKEAQTHRETAAQIKRELEEFKARFAAIEDPEAAMQALEIAKGLDSKSLIDSKKANEERERILADSKLKMEKLQAEHQKKMQELTGAVSEKDNQIFKLMVSDRFKSSPALKGTIYDGFADGAIAMLGQNFKIEGDKVVGYWNGEKVTSSNPNEVGAAAAFDDALTQMIDNHPNRDRIRLGGTGGHTGAGPGGKLTGGIVQATSADLKNPVKYKQIMEQVGGDLAKISIVDGQ